jgi:hypothetical protein
MRHIPLFHNRPRFGRSFLVGAVAAGLIGPSSASAQHRVIDIGRSTITVHVFKSGLFRAFADNHVIQAPLAEGSLDEGTSSRVQLTVDAARMRVLDPGLSPSDREQVRTRMLGPEVLDATRFPQIRFQSMSVERGESDGWLVRGELTLHGHTRIVTLKVAPEQGRYKGSTSLKQTDFAMTPISIAGGTVKVKDDVRIDFDIAVAPKGGQ